MIKIFIILFVIIISSIIGIYINSRLNGLTFMQALKLKFTLLQFRVCKNKRKVIKYIDINYLGNGAYSVRPSKAAPPPPPPAQPCPKKLVYIDITGIR